MRLKKFLEFLHKRRFLLQGFPVYSRFKELLRDRLSPPSFIKARNLQSSPLLHKFSLEVVMVAKLPHGSLTKAAVRWKITEYDYPLLRVAKKTDNIFVVVGKRA